MKKFTRTGKKVLSVFLAVLMVLTTWVFVAPTEAQAAAGTYPVSITFNLEDDDAVGGHVIVHYYPLNEAGTAFDSSNPKQHIVVNSLSKAAAKDHVYTDLLIQGMPYMLELKIDDSDLFDETYLELKYFKIGTKEIVSSSIGNYHNAICKFYYDGTFEPINADNGNSIGADDGRVDSVTGEGFTWGIPEPTTVTWSTVTAMTCPKTGTEPQTVSVSAKDQYGVELYAPSSWSVTAPHATTTSLYADPNTAGASTTIKVTNAANVAGATNTQTATITATWNVFDSNYSKTKTFTINDTTYTATFNYKDANGEDKTSTSTAKHGNDPAEPETYSYSSGDYDYTFNVWNPTATNIIKDTTYNATYTPKKVYADYTAVDQAIADANEEKAKYGTDYELKFTLASRVALDSAINSVVRGLGRTEQSDVDKFAADINQAIANLEPNKYDVIFLDKDGAILLYEKNVEYKQSVTAPELPAEQKVYYDSTNHYTFKEWDTNEYTSVTDDLVISPVYTTEAHVFDKTETVESNCVTKGATKYICACGYSYIDGESNYGDHVWKSEFEVDLEPTCTVAGSKSIHCSLCSAQKDITPIEPLGHIWSSQSVAVNAGCTNIGLVAKVCDECGVCEHTEIPATGHSFTDTVVNPTCTQKGYTVHTCQNPGCDMSYVDTYTALADHSYPTIGEVIQSAACGVAEITKYTCTECGNVKFESGEIPAHDDVNTMSWTVDIPATCEDDGYRAKICSKCNGVLVSEELSALTHDYKSEVVAPTCTAKGYTKKTCQRTGCGDVIYTDEVAARGHNWGTGVESEADCTHGAHILYTCQNNCGEKKYEIKDNGEALGHDYTVFVSKTEASCVNNGEEIYKCSRCGEEKITVLPKLGHNYVAGTAVDATCTESGYTPYTCENCGDTYNEYDASKPATGHIWKETGRTNATCTADGSIAYKCENCEETNTKVIPKLGHNYELKSSTKADCTTPATEVYECSVCKDTYTKYVAPANGHKYGDWETVTAATADKNGVQKRVCTVCGDVQYGTIAPIGNHNFKEEITKNATCTETGTKTFTCESHSNCSANYTETIPATGHKEELVYVAPTCSVEGSTKIICYTCGDTLSDVKIIPMTAHSYDDGKVTTNPTCTTDGEKTFTCSCGAKRTEVVARTGHVLSSSLTKPGCLTTGSVITVCNKGCGFSITTEIPATGHTLSVTTTPAKCTEMGSVVEECACGYKQTTEIAALGHNFSGTETIVTDASCTTAGSKNVKCINCTAVNPVVIPATGHAYKAGTKVDATCTESGYTPYSCDNCGDTYNKFDENPSGHNFTGGKETVTVEATCLFDGEKTVQCTKCNVTETRLVSRLGHAWGEWVTVDSTATTEGSKTRTCARGCTETVTLPKLGHEMVVDKNLSTAPKCQVEGEDVYVCTTHTNCGYTLKVTVAPTGHTFDGGTVTTDPTCDTDGEKTFTCSCGVTRTETVARTGHRLSTTFKKAKCDEEGEVLTKCADCTYKISTEIPATGHTWDNGTKTPASCTAEGKIVYACQNDCSATKEVTLDKLQHIFEEKETVAATCLMSSYTVFECKCGEGYYELSGNAKGHSWKEVADSSTATCINAGQKTLECSDCGKTMTVDVPALAHTFIQGATTPATCTDPSSTVYECACGEKYIELTKAANGHTWSNTWTVVVDATTDKNGVEKRVCTVSGCTAEEYRTIQPIGDHTFEEKITASATCTTVGKKTFTCLKHADCTANYEEEIPATGHTETITTNPATCETAGSTVTSCTVCGDTIKTETIPALGHLWSDGTVTKNATCSEKGEISYTCIRNAGHTKTSEIAVNSNAHVFVEVTTTAATCEKDGITVYECGCGKKAEIVTEKAAGHIWNTEKTLDKAADCTAPGLKSIHCSKCDAIKDAEAIPDTHNVTVTVSASNCTEEGSVTENCANCGYENITKLVALGHDYSGAEKIVTAATCEDNGIKTVQCTCCNSTTDVVIPRLGHKYGEWNKQPATNDDDGLWTRTCQNDTSHVETIVIPKGGHNLVEDKNQYVEPKCNSKGQQVYKCTNHTDCSIKVVIELDYAQHIVAKEIGNASCTAEGFIRTYCSACSEQFGEIITTSKLPHTYVGGKAVAPTCTTSGYIPYVCSCGASYNVYDDKNPATGHNLKEGSSTATCTTGGMMTLTCTNVNCSYATSVAVPALGHNYAKNSTTDATCAAAATETYKCTRCTASYTISVGEKTEAHDWNQWTVVEAATEGSLGYETRKCNVCHKLEVKTIQATGEHSYTVEKARKNATCTIDGWIEYSCATHNDCGLTSKVKIPATGHEEILAYTPAGCESEGSAKMICETCGTELSKESISALGHKWNDGVVTPSTCGTAGKIVYECTRNGCKETYETALALNPNAHQYTTTVIQPTCTTSGEVVTECKLCGYYKEDIIPASGHNWNDGEIKVGDEATCTKEGTKTYTCTVDSCGSTITKPVEKIAHSWNEWSVSKASTNTSEGELKRNCSSCTAEETISFPAGGHNLVVTEKENASCINEGSVTYDCDVHTGAADCGISVTVTLDKVQHKLVTTSKSALCEEDGYVETTCKNCNTVSEKTVIPATGHTYDDGVKTDATCTSKGKIIYTCLNGFCNDKKEIILEKLQHNYEKGEDVAPNCTQSGYTPYKCEDCESSYVIINAAAKGHSLTENDSTANCLDGGKMTLSCENCTYTTTVDVPALGHNYELNRTTSATCKDEATETYKCSRCNDEYTVSVGQKSTVHRFGSWVTVEATNTSLGYSTRKCDECGQIEFEIIPATGEHKFDILQSEVVAGCVTDGKKVYACSAHTDCGKTSEITIPATGHKEELSYKAADCDNDGYAKIVCNTCSIVISEEIIPALGHVWGNEKVTAPKCNANGKVEFTCICCNKATNEVTISANADAHVIKTETVLVASCKNEGKVVTSCTVCGETLAETTLPKLQHTWGEWEESVKATNTADGEKKRTCDNGCTETVVIPKGGHIFGDVPDEVDAATCKKAGTATYKCKVHDNCGVTITVKLEKIQHALNVDISDATCTKDGSVKVFCSSCKEVFKEYPIAKIAHSFKAIETVAPSCLKSGYTTYKCENCNEGYSEIGADATGHIWNTEAESTTDATCEENGSATYKCKFCEATNVVKLPATGHRWGVWSVEATADGDVLKRTCLNNGEHTEEYAISEGGHEYDLSNPETTEGDCQTPATSTFKCKKHADCGATITVNIGYGEHSWGEWTLTPGADKDVISRVCNNNASHRESYEIPAGGHEYDLSNPETTEGDCKTPGTSTFKCKKHADCGATITVNIGYGKHSFTTKRENPDCENDGFIKTYCLVCGEPISNEILEKLGHSYDKNGDGFVDVNDAVYTPATQNPDGTWTEGYYTYICQNGSCGKSYFETITETFEVRFFDSLGNQIGETQKIKLGQSAKAPANPEKDADENCHYLFSGWDRKFDSVTKDVDVYPLYNSEAHRGGVASCKSQAQCAICSEPYGNTDASKHIIISETIPATCEKDGKIIYTCSEGCGYSETKILKKSGHILSEWKTVIEGNCKTESVKIRTCLNTACDLVEEKTYIEPHTFITTKGEDSTCTKQGVTDHRYCVVCETEEGGEVIPVKEHRDLDGDGKCDYCGASQSVPECGCMCHSSGFMQIIYKIFRFFWIITRSQQKCSCGANHW